MFDTKPHHGCAFSLRQRADEFSQLDSKIQPATHFTGTQISKQDFRERNRRYGIKLRKGQWILIQLVFSLID